MYRSQIFFQHWLISVPYMCVPNLTHVSPVVFEIDRLTGFRNDSSNISFSFSSSSTRRGFINEPILINEVPLDLSRSGIVPFSPWIFCDFLQTLSPQGESVFKCLWRLQLSTNLPEFYVIGWGTVSEQSFILHIFLILSPVSLKISRKLPGDTTLPGRHSILLLTALNTSLSCWLDGKASGCLTQN